MSEFTQRGTDGVWRQGGGMSPADEQDLIEAEKAKREHYAEIRALEKARAELVKSLNSKPRDEDIRLAKSRVESGARQLTPPEFRCFAWALFENDDAARRRILRMGRVLLASGEAVSVARAVAEAA